MVLRIITPEMVKTFEKMLHNEEKSPVTIEKIPA